MARKKCKGTELSVFKGREAKLNRAIFQTLASKGIATIYDIHKEIRKLRGMAKIRYSSETNECKALKNLNYVNKTKTKRNPRRF